VPKERYDYIVAAYADMEEALRAAQIPVTSEVIVGLIVADELRGISNYLEFRGV
jgi:hypothetical protein